MREKLAIALVLAGAAVGGSALSSANVMSSSTNPANSFSAKADWVPPTSAASSPASQSSTSITVTYTSGDAGAGVKEVELWVKRPGDAAFSLAQTDPTPASPSFTYIAAGLGDYAFYTRARDNASPANDEAAPGSADTTTAIVAADTTKPVSEASSPAATNTSPFTVTYTAGDSGGSGLDRVELWVRRPSQSTYALAATDATPASPTFAYSPPSGTNGSYLFYTRAYDNAGNYEDAPATPPDTTTIFDTSAPSSAATSPAFTNASPFTVTYTHSAGSGSAVAEVDLYVRRPGDSGFSFVATDTDPSSASFSYTPGAGQGSYRFYTRARDAAGNVEDAPSGNSGDTSTLFDTTKPSSNATNGVDTTTNTSPFEVDYSSSDNSGGSGVLEVELWVKRPGDAAFILAQTDTSPSSSDFAYTPDAGDGTYAFYTRARDNAGNHEDPPASPDDSTVYAKRPRATAVSASNGALAAGKLEAGDQLVLSYDAAIDQTSIRASWTNPSLAQTITIAGSSGDVLSASTAGVNFGQVALNGDYLTTSMTFANSTMTIDAARTSVTIVLGTPSGGVSTTPLTARNMTYTPASTIKGANGQFIETTATTETDTDVDF